MRKISTTIYLEPDQFESLKEISEATGAPMAVLIRRGIDRELAVRRSVARRKRKSLEEMRNG